jgi:hypothetical protein
MDEAFKNACAVCILGGCVREKEWSHPCDRDEDGFYECEEKHKEEASESVVESASIK